MNKYDPKILPLVYLKDVPAGMSQYEFDTFIVGKHHSKARMIQDLLRRKSSAMDLIADLVNFTTLEVLEARQIVVLIDKELSKHNINDLNALEIEEPIYWINELARQSALEITTYGRIRPETQDKLMLLEEDQFSNAMLKTGSLVKKINTLAEAAYNITTPLPEGLPRT